MRQRLFLTWTIHHSCNYRCPYCFITTGQKDVFLENRYPGLDRLLSAWDRIHSLYGSCIIKFAGGEPFTYPDFMELLSRLGQRHFLDLSSNMYWDAAEFIRRVPPGAARIEPSYHPGFYPDLKEFAAKCALLKSRGFMGSVHMVAFPPVLSAVIAAKDYFASLGLDSVLLPFRGRHQDKPYPDSYSDEEKRLLQVAIAAAPAGRIQEVNKRYFDWYVDKQDRMDEAKRRLCLHGAVYAKIQPDLSVMRCCTPVPPERRQEFLVGSLLDPDFRLFAEARPCDLSPCSCWKPMLEGQEETWKPLWKFETYPVPEPR
ncbi:MAG: radical SAM protein [Elusimicrobia bacterium]|nr:radical SAM protein [Elusimicrobiota bacterium]